MSLPSVWSSAVPPSLWRVTLTDGCVVLIWADGVEGLSGPEGVRDYLFSNLIDVPVDEQEAFDVTARTPANPQRVVVTVARFPRSAVRDVESG